ncbi:iron chelate uptake ABC transporter family permease subunit [Nostocales cyanobacterium LEGE 12452]|nr:iron chelate uptake ABC transporter family permease subunit [Nostocales cyanobacterium LEGE 12452]
MSRSVPSSTRGLLSSLTFPVAGLIVGLLILLGCLIFSVSFGAADIPLHQILTAFIQFDGSREHLIIQTVRLPRSLLAILVGAAMSTAGGASQFGKKTKKRKNNSRGIIANYGGTIRILSIAEKIVAVKKYG